MSPHITRMLRGVIQHYSRKYYPAGTTGTAVNTECRRPSPIHALVRLSLKSKPPVSNFQLGRALQHARSCDISFKYCITASPGNMWRWPPCLLLLLLLLLWSAALPLHGAVVGGADQWERAPSGAAVLASSPHDPLFRGLCDAAGVMQSVGTGMLEGIQLRLVHIER